MKYLVIGASGFVGRYMLAHVRSQGQQAIGTQATSRLAGLVNFDLLMRRIRDCVDPAFFEGNEPVVAIICAAISQLDRCTRERSVTHVVNVDMTIRLIQDLRALKVKPVFLSSACVFDGVKGRYLESDVTHPTIEYGRHKEAVENYLRREVPEGLTLRLDKIIGDQPDERHLFSEWYGWVKEGKPIVCIRGQEFAPTSVEDAARAIGLSCEQGLSGLFHAASPEVYTREALAKEFQAAMGERTNIVSRLQEDMGFSAPRPLKASLDSTRFRAETGFLFTPTRVED